MQNEIIGAIFFGLGLAFQAKTFIGNEIKKEDRKQILIDIGAGFFFILLLLGGILRSFFIENDPVTGYLFLFYPFYMGFGTAFTLSFRDRIFSRINELSLFALNSVLLYYMITKMGYSHPFATIFYLPTIISLLLILFKNELGNYQKAFLSFWYLIILIFSSLFNLYYVSYFPDNYLYSSYISKFFSGGIFLFVYVLVIYLLTIIPMSGKSISETLKGEREAKERFFLLVSSFNKSKFNPFLSLLLFVILTAGLIFNFYYGYISENLITAFVIFFAVYLNSKISSPVILNNNILENK